MCACQRVRMRAQILSGGQVAPGERPGVGVTSPVEIRPGPARSALFAAACCCFGELWASIGGQRWRNRAGRVMIGRSSRPGLRSESNGGVEWRPSAAPAGCVLVILHFAFLRFFK